jgi:hypothetical protein
MRRPWLLALFAVAVVSRVAHGGMPSVGYTVSEASKMRIETFSFFLAGFFLSALFLKWLWNYLASEFTLLPRLTYGKALAMLTLWGMLFVLVLTMVSGARELMTPGAWERDGVTHKLRERTPSSGENP